MMSTPEPLASHLLDSPKETIDLDSIDYDEANISGSSISAKAAAVRAALGTLKQKEVITNVEESPKSQPHLELEGEKSALFVPPIGGGVDEISLEKTALARTVRTLSSAFERIQAENEHLGTELLKAQKSIAEQLIQINKQAGDIAVLSAKLVAQDEDSITVVREAAKLVSENQALTTRLPAEFQKVGDSKGKDVAVLVEMSKAQATQPSPQAQKKKKSRIHIR